MRLSIIIAHLVFGIRRFQNKHIKRIANSIKNKKVLELGSGKKINGKYPYSARKFFDNSNYFLMSDINGEYGHKHIDVLSMKFDKEWDLILCLNVLEHVFDFRKTIDNIYKALKLQGKAVILVPGYYPLHDEPYDYWRFTEHALKKLLYKFEIKIDVLGLRIYPIAYFIVAYKKE